MLGERSSVFKSIFLNPLVWIGVLLTLFTLEYNRDDVFGVFFAAETYRNLAIASAVYVGLFGRKYTDGMRRLDWNQTLGGVMEAMLVILFVWFFTLFGIVHYQKGGEAYSDLLRERYQREGNSQQNTAPKDNEAVVKIAPEMEKTLQNVEFKSGQRYKVTPNADGSFTVEVE